MEDPPKKKFENLEDAMEKKRKMEEHSRHSDSQSPVPDSDDEATTAAGNESLREFSAAAGSDIRSLASFTGTLEVAEEDKSKKKGGNGSDGGYDSVDEEGKVKTSCSSKTSRARDEKDRGPGRYETNQQK